LAVPIDPQGLDWTDFTQKIKPDAVIIVVEDRLGAINQARLAVAYLKKKYDGRIGVWLNKLNRSLSPETAQANRQGIKQSKIILAGESSYQNKKVIFNPEFWS
jgi:dethiobiotin synthetase